MCTACCGLIACAGQAPPPGGEQDRRPPVVVRTVPDTFARVGAFDGPVRFQFDERISEQVTGGLEAAVIVSPRTGRVRVRHGRRDISVSVEGGFQAGFVYRVTLLPVVRDMFSNQLQNPFELVFSTGAELTPNTVAGVVWDRITGQAVEGVEVRAGTPSVPAPLVAVSGQRGIYALRYLPTGSYRLMALEDLNRNGEADFVERQGFGQVELTGVDTVLVDMAVLPPDTTAAKLTRASVLDSVTLVLEVDDYLDPESPSTGIAVLVEREDGGPAPAIENIFQEHEYAAYVAAARDSLARLDSLDAAVAAAARDSAAAPDTAAAPPDSALAEDTPAVPAAPLRPLAEPDTIPPAVDTTFAAPDTTVRPAPPPRRRPPAPLAAAGGGGTRPGQGGGGAGRGPLPGRRVVVRLATALEMDVLYRVVLAGAVNINHLAEGGGVDTLRLAPPPPDTTRTGGPGR